MMINSPYINEFIEHTNPSITDIKYWIQEIEQTPILLRNSVATLNEEQLDITYRIGGWTIRQIVHHIADNNLNAYFRFKRTLTEENPQIPSYQQEKWAQMIDYKESITTSLQMIDSIYARFLVVVRSLDYPELKRTMSSVSFGVMSLEKALQRFLWHDRHHLAQIELVKQINL
jgi:hypothetical protein